MTKTMRQIFTQRLFLYQAVFLTVAGIFPYGKTVAQNADTLQMDRDTAIYELYDLPNQPEYPGGEPKMMEYIMNNMASHTISRDKGIRSTFPIEFIIEKDGRINQVRALRFPDDEIMLDIIRVIKTMPNWKPGCNQNGDPVRTKYIFPLTICWQ